MAIEYKIYLYIESIIIITITRAVDKNIFFKSGFSVKKTFLKMNMIGNYMVLFFYHEIHFGFYLEAIILTFRIINARTYTTCPRRCRGTCTYNFSKHFDNQKLVYCTTLHVNIETIRRRYIGSRLT